MVEKDKNSLEIPEGIGPHEGKELELMLAGKKPLAMFSDVFPSTFEWPDQAFEPYVLTGKLVKKEFMTKTPDGNYNLRCLFYALPEEVWRIDEAFALSIKHNGDNIEENIKDAFQMGYLLGYQDKDVQTFIDWCKLF